MISMANTRILNDKYQQLAIEYVNSNFDAVKAMLACGYSKSYAITKGKKIFNNPKVSQIINKITSAASINAGVTADQIIADLLRGKAMAEEKGDLTNYNKSLELLGKTIALFTDKQITENASSPHQLNRPAAIDGSVKRLLAVEFQDNAVSKCSLNNNTAPKPDENPQKP